MRIAMGRICSAVVVMFLIAGCGGGGAGGGSTPAASILGGVGAVGTPIVNATINVICAAGSPISTTTSTAGPWQLTLSGQTPPCAVELTGGTINGKANTTIYTSIAIAAGTVNVTPLTDLLVAYLVGTATPSTWFAGLSSPSAALAAITQTKVNTALAIESAALSGLTPLSTTNPITTPFTPTSGNVMDDMLTALATALTNTGVTYASLLSAAAASSSFNAALNTAYTGTPSGSTYTIGGTVTGLTGIVVLQDNSGDNLTVSANGTFTFATKVAYGSPYSVTVLTQPSGQTCTVSTGTGTVSVNNVTNVVVVCASDTYTVGGSVTGLTGSVVLQDNSGDNLTVSANGTFTFPTKVANSSPYNVTVLSHPSSQSCSVASGTGTIALANVTNIIVTCATNTYTIGGTVTGLSGTVVLQDNDGDNLTIAVNGSFAFPTAVANGNAYTVTVLTQPSGQTCTVSTGTGTVSASNVTNVAVVCTTDSYSVGGSVSGLTGSVVLQDNGGDNLTVSGNGAFTFATKVAYGNPYSVTVLTQPSGQTCTVSTGTGTVSVNNVTNVAVVCASDTYSVGGSVTGLTGTVVLQDNSGDNLTVSANGTFTFPTKAADSSPYSVTVLTQPTGQSCSVATGTGTIAQANVTNIVVTCAINAYTTSFTPSESTLSEGGMWVNNDPFWTAVKTENISGTQVAHGTMGSTSTYRDSHARITDNSFLASKNQTVTVTIWVDPVNGRPTNGNAEVELWMGVVDNGAPYSLSWGGPFTTYGYTVYCNQNYGGAFYMYVSFMGPADPGNVAGGYFNDILPATGDIFSAKLIDNGDGTVNIQGFWTPLATEGAYTGGVTYKLIDYHDTAYIYAAGYPGIGFYVDNTGMGAGATLPNNQFGISSFTATSP